MKALVCAVSVVALAGPAAAESRYDRKLEEAVMAIVAAKIGDIRGGFAFDAKPVMVVVQDDIVMGTTGMNAGAWRPRRRARRHGPRHRAQDSRSHHVLISGIRLPSGRSFANEGHGRTRKSEDRVRLDELLVSRGLYASRSRARDAIERGAVTVDGAVVAKPGQAVAGVERHRHRRSRRAATSRARR